ncbi:MAG: LytTR family DNA-binding domain-containing protein [Lachnospiraceae bacterium]|nr:LytTR family DNA-binding domain-containing protein [Lachnospiraceae bacterium]
MGKTVIGICDDFEEVVDNLKGIVIDCMDKMNGIDYTINGYVSPKELIKEIKNIDIVFLDIEMPEMDGIEVGYKIKELNPNCIIILASSRIDRFKDAFYINTFRFITKPFAMSEVEKVLEDVILKLIGNNEIEVYYNRRCYKIKEKDIIAIRAYNGYVEVLVGNMVFRKDTSLKELEKQIDGKLFCRVNRQIVIGYRYLTDYTRDSVTVGGVKYKLTYNHQRELIDGFMRFDLDYRRCL